MAMLILLVGGVTVAAQLCGIVICLLVLRNWKLQDTPPL